MWWEKAICSSNTNQPPPVQKMQKMHVRRNSGPSLRNLASTVNPTLFPPLQIMKMKLVRGNPVQPTRATHGVQIRGPPTFTGERPVFSVGSSITLAHEKVVVDKGKKYLANGGTRNIFFHNLEFSTKCEFQLATHNGNLDYLCCKTSR
ncbi:tetratricopeptide repeat protein [Striga asiatica]|uniref:Tetratricopeptide repeat protein n=1 Tax=Striga asiatica TaxID=4170 RepID=A0A5A7PB39_STRAF|nr:tetratricopeptide repeat protein [Striga asiatica]